MFELFSFLTRVKDISVLEKEKKTLKKECEVHSSDIIYTKKFWSGNYMPRTRDFSGNRERERRALNTL